MADNEGEPTQAAAEEQPAGETTEAPQQEGEATAADAEAEPVSGESAAPEPAAEEPPAEESASAEQPGSEEAADTETADKTEEGDEPAVESAAEPSAEPSAEQSDEPAAEQSDETADAPPADAADAEAEPVAEAAATEEGEAQPAAEGGEAVEGEAPPADGEAGGEGEKPEGEGEEKTEGEAQPAEGEGGEEKPEGEGGEGEPPAEGEAVAAEGEEKPEGEAGEEGEKSPVPQSDTFAEGEMPEEGSGVQIAEQLSREPTPPIKEDTKDEDYEQSRLDAGTPQKLCSDTDVTQPLMEVHEEGGEDLEEEEEEMYDRDALIERYHMALAERESLLQQNYQLQHKLADYFRKKKNDERQDYDKNVTDQEQRYLKYMAQLGELHEQDHAERESYQQQMEELKARCEDRRQRVDEERQRFVEFKRQVALNAINSRSGKPIAPKDIEQYLVTETKKETEVVNVRLENIKLKNKLKKKEQQLKSKEELAEGLHLIDFEQLKIENQTYNEKIEERNEELLKLRKKITSTVQVLTHLKEKLQFVQGENQIQKGSLQVVEAEVAQKRDILSRTKQARDSLRIDNQRLRQNSGLLGNEPLLRDFEERKDEGDHLREKLDRLKMQHAELTLNCNQVRRKIEQARGARQ